MNPEASVKALLSTARLFVGVREEPGNRGVVPDFMNWLHSGGDWRDYPVGLKGAPYCATFLGTVGRLALGIQWPIPTTPAMSSADNVAAWGQQQGLVVAAPQPGDILCVWYGARFGHVAIVREVLPTGRVATIEGNTDEEGSREGRGIFERQRPVRAEDRLLRWVTRFPASQGFGPE